MLLLLIISITSFLSSIWWLVAKITGTFLAKLIMKVLGLVGTTLPIVYWLKLLNII